MPPEQDIRWLRTRKPLAYRESTCMNLSISCPYEVIVYSVRKHSNTARMHTISRINQRRGRYPISASQFVGTFLKAYATLHQVMTWQHIISLAPSDYMALRNSYIEIHFIPSPWQIAVHKVSRLNSWSCGRIDTEMVPI